MLPVLTHLSFCYWSIIYFYIHADIRSEMVISGSEVGQTEEVCVHDISRCMCDDQNEKTKQNKKQKQMVKNTGNKLPFFETGSCFLLS